MDKYLILLAGPPATGKTYLVNLIQQVLPNLFEVTPDELKEDIADSQGFDNLEEKTALEKIVWASYYQILDAYMKVGKRFVLSEYPFSYKQRDKLSELGQKYGYHILTIRLVGQFEALWKRRQERDRLPERHLSHIMSHYHFGDVLLDREKADHHITKEEFRNIIQKRGYQSFSLGEVFEYDVTDFSNVHYDELLHYLASL